jgi:hypothetical protein
MNTSSSFSLATLLAVAGLLLGGPPTAQAYPRTKEKAEITLTAQLAPADPASGASGTASLEVARLNGTETLSELDVALTGLADGIYTVTATKTSDGLTEDLGTISVVGATTAPELLVPDELDPTDIATLTVLDDAGLVVLSGAAELGIAKWTFAANVKVTAPVESPAFAGDKKSKIKKMHGHVLVHSLIVNDVEMRRKFLLVAHNGPVDTLLTINIDGVAAGTLLTTKKGKMMAKSLPGEVRLAGMEAITLTDINGVVVAEATLFPAE